MPRVDVQVALDHINQLGASWGVAPRAVWEAAGLQRTMLYDFQRGTYKTMSEERTLRVLGTTVNDLPERVKIDSKPLISLMRRLLALTQWPRRQLAFEVGSGESYLRSIESRGGVCMVGTWRAMRDLAIRLEMDFSTRCERCGSDPWLRGRFCEGCFRSQKEWRLVSV